MTEFPVVWEREGDERLFWTFDPMHNPDPVTPLEHELMRDAFFPGAATAAQALGQPIAESRRCRLNTYVYTSMVPSGSPPAPDAAQRVDRAIATIGERWRTDYRPTADGILATLRALDTAHAPVPGLVDAVVRQLTRLGDVHFALGLAGRLAIARLEEPWTEGGDLDAHRLLQGLRSSTTDTADALWDLSRVYGSAGFDAALRTFLERHGERGDLFTFSTPFWVEDPAPVLATVRQLAELPDDRDPRRARAERAAESEGLAEGFAFPGALAAAREAVVAGEDRTYFLDYRGFYAIRCVLLGIGARLRLDDRHDVFMLTLDELREEGGDRRATVLERRRDMDRWSVVTPPPTLGTPPQGPPPGGAVGRMLARIFGTGPRPSDGKLSGLPGSSGRATGRARILRSVREAGRLHAGDILVATTTSPSWTPLFTIAGAVVAETGGALSHCALVARELGIPAVVGCAGATRAIRDGDLVEVDGDTGSVRVLP